jgi:hypothetical protein
LPREVISGDAIVREINTAVTRTSSIGCFLHIQAGGFVTLAFVIGAISNQPAPMTHAAMLGVEARIVRVTAPTTR